MINSINDLAWRIGIPRDRLEMLARKLPYDEWSLQDKKNPAKRRQVRSPRGELKEVQRRLNRHIFSTIPPSEIAHGGLPGRSPKTNAQAHLGKRCVITIDVKQFYDRVRHEFVYQLLRKELGFGRDVARLLTRLTTYNDALPQGAPTSLPIANLLLLAPLDNPLSREAKRLGIDPSRFVDDIAMSGDNPRQLINEVAKSLSRRRLPIHRRPRNPEKSKLKIMPNSGPQEITGLLVNSRRGPTLSKTKRDRVRSSIHELASLQGEERAKAIRSITGRIEHVRQYNPGSAKRLKANLSAVLKEASSA